MIAALASHSHQTSIKHGNYIGCTKWSVNITQSPKWLCGKKWVPAKRKLNGTSPEILLPGTSFTLSFAWDYSIINSWRKRDTFRLNIYQCGKIKYKSEYKEHLMERNFRLTSGFVVYYFAISLIFFCFVLVS